MMKFTAVVFDLFGTLVRDFSRHSYDIVYQHMAQTLDAPLDDFRQAFGRSFQDRSVGVYDTIEQNISHVCVQLGLSPSSAAIQQAAAHRYAFIRDTITPSQEVLDTLATLKQMGLRLGLISNCGPDVPQLWPQISLATHLDTALFSCRERLQKPAPELYHSACHRLQHPPSACVYVGDGSSEELTGAKQAGMVPVLKRTNLGNVYDHVRPEVDSWQGHAVDEIRELPALISQLQVRANG
ncbi:HAD family hydrolase [Candidatus Entotheonella palauensis]|uniref:HAD family hydrolase n=1 Tax=Candidatus Entotheonella palauensis TaxID=93172 RepID=UPI000B7F036C|nr:HAD family hydrolase [Candidatus Entotheonella palauensis]